MKVILEGNPKEIAALVVELQERQVAISDDTIIAAVNRFQQIQDRDQPTSAP